MRLVVVQRCVPGIAQAVARGILEFPTWAWAAQSDALLAAHGRAADSWAAAARHQGVPSETRYLGTPGLEAAARAESLAWAEDAVVLFDGVLPGAEWSAAIAVAARVTLLRSTRGAPTPAQLAAGGFAGLVTPSPVIAKGFVAAGVPTLALPAAFDPRHADGHVDGSGGRNQPWARRDIPAMAVAPWEESAHVLDACAASVPGFRRHGAADRTRQTPRRTAECHLGPLPGDAYGDALGRACVVVDRHDDEATAPRGDGTGRKWYTTNQVTVDAPGMGALLLTEQSANLARYLEPWRECVPYGNPNEAVAYARRALDKPDWAEGIATAGAARVWREHLVVHRVPRLLEFAAEVS